MVAAVSSTHQQISASPSASSSAGLCTGLSSTRHDGEPLSQGISPATLTAITAVPSAASDGLVIASTVQVPVGGKVNRPAAAPAEPISGEPISAGASLATITAIEAMPSAAPDGMVIAGSLTQQHTSASRSTSSSAAMGTNLSSARCGGEPRSQGISPTTSTSRINSGGYTSRASRASRVSNTGRIRPHQAPSGRTPAAAAPAEPISGEPYRRASRPSRSQLSQRYPQWHRMAWSQLCPRLTSKSVLRARRLRRQHCALDSPRHGATAINNAGHLAHLAHSYHSGALSGIGWLGHHVNCSITCRWQGQPSNRCHSHGCHCHLAITAITQPSAASDGVIAAVSSTQQHISAFGVSTVQ